MMNTTPSDDELQQAIALHYDGYSSPTITAKGQGQVAEEIIALAKAHHVALCENPVLLEALMHLELGDHIPENLYLAIAQIIAFAYQLEEAARG